MDNFERQSIAIQNGIFLTFTVMYSISMHETMIGRKGLVLKYTIQNVKLTDIRIMNVLHRGLYI